MSDRNDQIIQGLFGTPDPSASLGLAVDFDPDQEAQHRRTARTIGVPPGTSRNMPDEAAKAARRQRALRDARELLNSSSLRTSRFLSDPTRSAVAHDDVGVLGAIEQHFSGFFRGIARTIDSALLDDEPAADRVAIAGEYLAAKGKSGIHALGAAGAQLWWDIVGVDDEDLAARFKDDPAGLARVKASAGYFPARKAQELQAQSERDVRDMSPRAAQRYEGRRYATTDPANAAWASPVRILGDAIQSLPTTAALALTTFLTRGAATRAEAASLARGATAAEARQAAVSAGSSMAARFGAASEGTVGGVQQQVQTQSDVQGMPQAALDASPQYQALIADGYSPEAARMALAARAGKSAGIGAAVVDAATNLVGGGVLGRIIGEGGSIASRVGKGALNEGVTEAVQSAGEQLAQNAAIRSNVDPHQSLVDGVLESAVQGLVVGGVTGGALTGMLGREIRREENLAQAEAASQFVADFSRLVAASKTATRSPRDFRDFLEAAADGSPVEDLYVSPEKLGEVLNQAANDPDAKLDNPQAILAKALAEKYGPRIAQAIVEDHDLQISIAEFGATLAGNPIGDALLEHLKVDPHGMSKAEAEEFMATRGEDLRAEVEKTLARSERDAAWQQSSDAVREAVLGQLNAVSRFNKTTNERYADLHAAFYATLAQRLGTTPQEIFKHYPVTVQATNPAGESFAQAIKSQTETPEFKAWFGDSKVVDEKGKPLVVYHGTSSDFKEFARIDGGNAYGAGFYFTDDPAEASGYADGSGGGRIAPSGNAGPNVMPVFLSAKNPYRFDKRSLSRDEVNRIEKASNKIDPGTWKKGELWKSFDSGYQPTAQNVPQYVMESTRQSYAELLREAGYDMLDTPYGFVVFDPTQIKSAIGNNGNFDPADPNILRQPTRGAYSPATDTITLLASADLSTFLHESGHFFLEVMHRLAADPTAPQQVRDDFGKLLKWFGVKDLATWNGMSLEQKREHHEKFARGFEAYLFTGKAPSATLRDMFRQFRAWLVAVYKKAVNLNVTVSPTVRGVFDRMLATDQQIEEAEAARSMLPLFDDEAASGMSKDQWQAYQALAANATATAKEQLDKRSLGNMRWLANARGRELKKLQRNAASTRKAVRSAVASEVESQPVYRAISFLKRGTLDGVAYDGAHKLSIEEVDALYPDEAARNTVKTALGYGAYGMLGSGENALHPEQVAELFGFTSADHLIRELIAAEPKGELIEGLTERRLLEEHGDATDPQAIERAADEAVHNELRARSVAAELSALQRASSVRSGRVDILASAARNFAKETVARLKIRDLKPALYEAAAARAGKAALKAMGEGKTTTAAAEKRNQLINLFASKEALAARQEVEKALDYFARIQGAGAVKSIDASYRAQIDAILESIDLRRGTTLKQIDRATSLAQWIEQQRELGFEPVIPDALLTQIGKRSYKQLSVEELRGIVDAIKNIEHLGRLKTRLLTAKKDRDFDSARGKIVDSVTQFAYKDVPDQIETRGFVAGVKKGWYKFLAMHRKFASLAREIDGGKDGGALWEYLVRPMNEAGDREAAMRAEATAKLFEILGPVMPKLRSMTKLYIPEINVSLSYEGRLAAALNLGNSINRERLMSGERWSNAQIDALAATLDAQDWAIVQALWDHINSYWPQVAAKEVRVSGVAPEKVDAEPLRVVTSDGQTLDLPGGYYPIKYNADRSDKAGQHSAAEIATQSLRGAYTRSTTRRGHTKARIESTGLKLRYDLGVITQHLTEVIHDLTHHEFLIDANRLLRDKSIAGSLRNSYGPETLAALRDALTDIAAGDVPAQNVFESSLNYLRSGVSIAGMGFSFTTALLQPTGLVQSAKRVGPKWMMKGLASWFGSPAEMSAKVDWIYEQSAFMQNRMRTQQREMAEIRNQIAKSKVRNAINAAAFWPIAKMQMLADVPTWLGQYEKSVARGEEHERAVALADQAVLDAQGGGQAKDLAQIQRGGPLQKLWTSFYSYFNVQYNILAESVADTRRAGPTRLPLLAADVVTVLWLPAVLQTLIFAALRGDDDPEKLLKDMGKGVVASTFGIMVGLRELGSVIQSDGRANAPAGIIVDRVSKLYGQAQQGEIDEAFLRAANQLGGVLFHYPAAQIDRTARGFEALASGQTSNPLVLAVGPPKSAAK